MKPLYLVIGPRWERNNKHISQTVSINTEPAKPIGFLHLLSSKWDHSHTDVLSRIRHGSMSVCLETLWLEWPACPTISSLSSCSPTSRRFTTGYARQIFHEFSNIGDIPFCCQREQYSNMVTSLWYGAFNIFCSRIVYLLVSLSFTVRAMSRDFGLVKWYVSDSGFWKRDILSDDNEFYRINLITNDTVVQSWKAAMLWRY